MMDFRCSECNRLLARIEGACRVEIKCPRCKAMNLFTETREVYITIEGKKAACTDPEIAEN